jgi:hypothetical protein
MPVQLLAICLQNALKVGSIAQLRWYCTRHGQRKRFLRLPCRRAYRRNSRSFCNNHSSNSKAIIMLGSVCSLS